MLACSARSRATARRDGHAGAAELAAEAVEAARALNCARARAGRGLSEDPAPVEGAVAEVRQAVPAPARGRLRGSGREGPLMLEVGPTTVRPASRCGTGRGCGGRADPGLGMSTPGPRAWGELVVERARITALAPLAGKDSRSSVEYRVHGRFGQSAAGESSLAAVTSRSASREAGQARPPRPIRRLFSARDADPDAVGGTRLTTSEGSTSGTKSTDAEFERREPYACHRQREASPDDRAGVRHWICEHSSRRRREQEVETMEAPAVDVLVAVPSGSDDEVAALRAELEATRARELAPARRDRREPRCAALPSRGAAERSEVVERR